MCEPCAERTRTGRDSTTRAVKTLQRSLSAKAMKAQAMMNGSEVSEELEYDMAASEYLAAEAFQAPVGVRLVEAGEVRPGQAPEFLDTLATPTLVSLDASSHRLDLITSMGTDVAAMALDASDTMGATNSLEKMLAHQLAVLHQSAMKTASTAALEQDAVHMARLLNLSIRSMETFQKGLLTLKRMRSTGEQRITIERVSVMDGGQAVIGALQTGGCAKK